MLGVDGIEVDNTEKSDVIVVGAGPAGTTTTYVLAKEGAEVS